MSKYSHIHKAFITVEKLRWSRIPLASEDGKIEDHPHAFLRDGDDKRITSVEIDATAGKDKIVGKVTSGISDLLVLKSTGSAFENYYRDEYTTLISVDDRIFSTAVDLTYTYAPISIPSPTDEKKLEFTLPTLLDGGGIWDGEAVASNARNITLEVFATDESASVQATLYKMAQRLVAENEHVISVTYTLPNKHYIPVNMEYIGIDNMTPSKAEVFTPVAAPSGLISATISRE